jgi:cytoskeletal protein CcmA (bactofilin family)
MMDNASFRSTGDPIGAASRAGGRESVIDRDCFFEGTFRTPGNMRIEGTYQGAIECQGTLLIAESGQVNARIVAGNMIVAGQFSGEVQCQSRFELLQSGRVSGSVTTQSTVVHDGAHFDGEIRMGARDASPARQPTIAQAQTPPAAQSPVAPPAPRPAATGSSNRRRAGGEAAGEGDTPSEPDIPAQDEPAPATAPRTNGRSQAAARDIVPNRTGES